MANTTRIASWNIWIFGKRDYMGMAKLIKRNKIDIIGIQEAALYYGGNRTLDIAKSIAKELGYNYVFFKSTDIRPRLPIVQGNAIISRFPILASRSYALNSTVVKAKSAYEKEQRILVAAKIKAESGSINFLTTHLQYSRGFKSTPTRMAQARKIASIIRGLGGYTVLTGDFNSLPSNKEIGIIEGCMTRIGGDAPTWTVHPFSLPGWTENRLKYRIDNIFLPKGKTCKRFKVLRSKLSDHLPIMADISL
jgi:endonuclease/exonuclease/phosphatase family metal-dependent hydrolase